MAFVVSKTTWLQVEGDRVQAIITVPRFWRRKWDDKSLLKELNDIGLAYTLDEIKVLNDELHTRGIVEDVLSPNPVSAIVEPVTDGTELAG